MRFKHICYAEKTAVYFDMRGIILLMPKVQNKLKF
jgi:hypothetical protein